MYPDPDPGGPKTCGSGGSGSESGSATLEKVGSGIRNTDLSPVTMLGAVLVFSQLLEIPPGHPDPTELAVGGGGGPVSRVHSQPGEQGEAFVQLYHRLECINRVTKSNKRLGKKYAISNAEYHSIIVDDEKKDEIILCTIQ
jgi:hypothetical protein